MTALSPGLWGALVGAALGTGAWLVVAGVTARRPTLEQRLSPYLRPGRSLPGPRTPFVTLERLLAPVMSDAVRVAERYGSPSTDVARRLQHAGREPDVQAFRAEQVVWSVLGVATGLAAATLLVLVRDAPLALGLLVVALGGVAGAVARDQLLTTAARRRGRRLVAELPAVAELLALAVTAGEGANGAVERVSRRAHGELAGELRRVVGEVRTGEPLARALDRLAERAGVPAVSRFTEAVAVAVDRGTPLAEVLRAQAQDAREAGRRELMESGGRKEVAMLVPVVLLILPVTVVFAVFPGLLALRLDLS